MRPAKIDILPSTRSALSSETTASNAVVEVLERSGPLRLLESLDRLEAEIQLNSRLLATASSTTSISTAAASSTTTIIDTTDQHQQSNSSANNNSDNALRAVTPTKKSPKHSSWELLFLLHAPPKSPLGVQLETIGEEVDQEVNEYNADDDDNRQNVIIGDYQLTYSGPPNEGNRSYCLQGAPLIDNIDNTNNDDNDDVGNRSNPNEYNPFGCGTPIKSSVCGFGPETISLSPRKKSRSSPFDSEHHCGLSGSPKLVATATNTSQPRSGGTCQVVSQALPTSTKFLPAADRSQQKIDRQIEEEEEDARKRFHTVLVVDEKNQSNLMQKRFQDSEDDETHNKRTTIIDSDHPSPPPPSQPQKFEDTKATVPHHHQHQHLKSATELQQPLPPLQRRPPLPVPPSSSQYQTTHNMEREQYNGRMNGTGVPQESAIGSGVAHAGPRPRPQPRSSTSGMWVVKRPSRHRPKDQLRLEGSLDMDTTFRSTIEQLARQRIAASRLAESSRRGSSRGGQRPSVAARDTPEAGRQPNVTVVRERVHVHQKVAKLPAAEAAVSTTNTGDGISPSHAQVARARDRSTHDRIIPLEHSESVEKVTERRPQRPQDLNIGLGLQAGFLSDSCAPHHHKHILNQSRADDELPPPPPCTRHHRGHHRHRQRTSPPMDMDLVSGRDRDRAAAGVASTGGDHRLGAATGAARAAAIARRRRHRPATSLKLGGEGYYSTLSRDSYKNFVIANKDDRQNGIANGYQTSVVKLPPVVNVNGGGGGGYGMATTGRYPPQSTPEYCYYSQATRANHLRRPGDVRTTTGTVAPAGVPTRPPERGRVADQKIQERELSRRVEELSFTPTGGELTGRVSRSERYGREVYVTEDEGGRRQKRIEERIIEMEMPPRGHQNEATKEKKGFQQQERSIGPSKGLEAVKNSEAEVPEAEEEEELEWEDVPEDEALLDGNWTISGHSHVARAPIKRNTDHIGRDGIVYGSNKDEEAERAIRPLTDIDIVFGHRNRVMPKDHIKEYQILEAEKAERAAMLRTMEMERKAAETPIPRQADLRKGSATEGIDNPTRRTPGARFLVSRTGSRAGGGMSRLAGRPGSSKMAHYKASNRVLAAGGGRKGELGLGMGLPPPAATTRQVSRVNHVRRDRNAESGPHIFQNESSEDMYLSTTNQHLYNNGNMNANVGSDGPHRYPAAGKATRGRASRFADHHRQRNLFKESPEDPLTQTGPFDGHTTYRDVFREDLLFHCPVMDLNTPRSDYVYHDEAMGHQFYVPHERP